MRVVNTDKLNRLWKNGILPLRDAIANIRLKLANNLLTTEEGFGLDARQGPVIQGEIDELQGGLDEVNSKLSPSVKTISGGGATVTYQKTADMVCAGISLIGAVIPAGWTTLSEVPDGFKPKYSGYGSGIDISGNYLTVQISGDNVRVYSNAGFTANYLFLTVAYLCQ